jgi:hypothetical protein
MTSTITRLMAVAAVAVAALLLVAAMSLARTVSPAHGSSSATLRPAAPTTHTVASASRFSPQGRRWV